MPQYKPRENATAIINYIKSIGGIAKKNGGGYDRTGENDIVGCYKGHCLYIEVKRPGEDATPIQLAMARKWAAAGAIIGTVHDRHEMESIIKEIGQ